MTFHFPQQFTVVTSLSIARNLYYCFFPGVPSPHLVTCLACYRPQMVCYFLYFALSTNNCYAVGFRRLPYPRNTLVVEAIPQVVGERPERREKNNSLCEDFCAVASMWSLMYSARDRFVINFHACVIRIHNMHKICSRYAVGHQFVIVIQSARGRCRQFYSQM